MHQISMSLETKTRKNRRRFIYGLRLICNFREKANDADGSRKDQKSERGGRNQRGRGGKNNNANFKKGNNLIQSVGFLSEGIAAAPLNRRSDGGFGGSSRDSVAEVLQKPKIVKRDTKPEKSDLDAEQKKLSALLGDGGDDELDLDEDDSKTSSDDFLPIKIKDRKFKQFCSSPFFCMFS